MRQIPSDWNRSTQKTKEEANKKWRQEGRRTGIIIIITTPESQTSVSFSLSVLSVVWATSILFCNDAIIASRCDCASAKTEATRDPSPATTGVDEDDNEEAEPALALPERAAPPLPAPSTPPLTLPSLPPPTLLLLFVCFRSSAKVSLIGHIRHLVRPQVEKVRSSSHQQLRTKR